MIELLSEGNKILNIDETWLNESLFIRQKWKQKGTTNSIEENVISPRISLIGAIDTEGDVYLSLTQVTTDQHVMKLFLSKLAMQLDGTRATWRDDTIIMLDGASYHTNEEVRKHMGALSMKYIFTGPR